MARKITLKIDLVDEDPIEMELDHCDFDMRVSCEIVEDHLGFALVDYRDTGKRNVELKIRQF
jgi:hypothetical protein